MSIEQTTRDIESKLEQAEEIRSKERSTQVLLNFEISQLNNFISRTKKTIESLIKEEQRLIELNQDASQQIKRIQNYFGYLGPMQADRKAEWMQNLRGELNSLDFTLEEFEEQPSRSVDTFTQVNRR